MHSAQASALESKIIEETAGPKPKVLLVDDHPANLTALERVLESLDTDIVKAASGEEALRFLLRDDFAVILLDVRMPNMDGFETAEIIRSRERTRHTPILFLTAHRGSDETMYKGYLSGAVDFLLKPINPDVLRSKVSVFIELSRKSDLLRRTADQLQQLNATLEKRVTERTSALTRANDELRQFAYAASHDLQEPLRTIATFTQLLTKEASDNPDLKKYEQFITDGVRRMGDVLSGLLAWSQASDRPFDLTRTFSLEDAIRAAIANLEATITENKAIITFGPMPIVPADSIWLTQLLQNLIGNAVKYRRPEAPPIIRIESEEHADEHEITVRDNGQGIDARYTDQIFGIFKRLHGRDMPGTGIGLAICRKIVERHGGRIWVESVPGQGSTFHFTLSKTTPAAPVRT